MQYISSLILEYVPFVASPDFQLVVSTATAGYLAILATKKLLRILFKVLKLGVSLAVIAAILYLVLVGNPIKDKERTFNYVKTELPIFVKKEIPTIVALLKD